MANAFSFDVKGIIAVLVIIGSFGLIGIYVERSQVPDATIVAFVSLPLGAVIGFYFGHINGAATALANSAISLSSSALQAASQRRVGDPTLAGQAAGAAAAAAVVPAVTQAVSDAIHGGPPAPSATSS